MASVFRCSPKSEVVPLQIAFMWFHGGMKKQVYSWIEDAR